MDNTKLLNTLSNNICEIVFEKRDGTHRHMICTLKSDLLPPKKTSTGEISKDNTNVDFIPVYDLEEQAWRSFKPSKLISIESNSE